MQIETLKEYLEFAKYLNFSTAAKKLFMSQPALSNHIANLEKELGVDLVRRDHNLELTAAGKAFFEGSSKIVSSYDALLTQVKALGKSEMRGSFSIKMAFGETLRLSELIGDFKRTNPAVSVKFVKQGRSTVVDDLLSGVFDCALLFNFVPEANSFDAGLLDCLVIDKAPLTVAARSEHPLMSKKGLVFDDLVAYPYAMPAGADFEECYISVEQLYSARGYELKNVHFKVADTITDLVTSCTNDDEFLLLGDSPQLPKGMTYRYFEPMIYQDFCLVYRKDNQNPALRSFTAFVQQSQECQQGDDDL